MRNYINMHLIKQETWIVNKHMERYLPTEVISNTTLKIEEAAGHGGPHL